MLNKFSIIVPIYNAEKYLSECLDSILFQNYEHFEVIMVDDGSTDNSNEICQFYCNKDDRFKLIVQKNQGVSSARNKALELVTGNFILFVDSDDILLSNSLKFIEKKIKDNDLLCFGYYKYYLNNQEAMILKNDFFKKKDDYLNAIIFNQEFGGYLWNKCFKTDIIKKYSIKFDEELHYCEDLLFIMEYSKHCDKICYLNKILYKYRMRKSSVSYNFFNRKNISMLNSYEKLINRYSNHESITNRLKFLYIYNYYKIKKIIPKDYKVNKSILNDERNIIANEKLKLKDKMNFLIIKKINWLYRILRTRKNDKLGLFE